VTPMSGIAMEPSKGWGIGLYESQAVRKRHNSESWKRAVERIQGSFVGRDTDVLRCVTIVLPKRPINKTIRVAKVARAMPSVNN